MMRVLFLSAVIVFAPVTASAASCPRNPDALGTARVIEVDAKSTPRVGRKQFPSTLPLHAKELVLTFDDGPDPEWTPRILAAGKVLAVLIAGAFIVIAVWAYMRQAVHA